MGTEADGHYYRKQLGCRCGVIAWSHRSRFRTGLRLVGPGGGRLLDYGCGDGTFLAMAADRVRQGVGADVVPGQVDDCRRRLADRPNLRFCMTADLADPAHDRSFDVVTCMETLEHCPAPVVEVVLRDLARLVSPAGRVVISVPIETGPTFLLKAAVRGLAAHRGLSDYRFYERYRPADALRMLFAGRREVLERPVIGGPDAPTHTHYGFNWRALRERVRAHLHIERTRFSPLAGCGPWVNSQAWFVCRPRV